MNAHEVLWFERHGRRYFSPVRDPHLRPDPFLRHDAHFFLPPQLQMAMKAAERSLTQTESAIGSEQQRREAASQLRALLDLKADIVKLRSDLVFERFKRTYYRWLEAERLRRKAGFRPEQPRWPVGSGLISGRWSDGSGARVQLAGTEKTPSGAAIIAAIAAETAKRLIENYRKDNNLRDLFGRDRNTVTVTTMDGKDIFGTNSTSPTYDNRLDRPAANRLRDALIEKYPDIMKTENIGEKPNDAIYHAETTVLLRAARENGGTLAGRTLEVRGDRPMCESCEKVLPYIGLELGNPKVTYIDSIGRLRTMNNGSWVK